MNTPLPSGSSARPLTVWLAFGFQGSTTLLATVNAATRLRVPPPLLPSAALKMPPAYSVGPSSRRTWMPPKSSAGACVTPPVNEVRAPARVKPAKFVRAPPFALENPPPAYTAPAGLSTASARTVPLVVGVQFGSTDRSAITWARSVRGKPPTDLKSPPRNQPPLPSEATALTTPSTSGQGFFRTPFDASNSADDPVYGPIRVKLPPMYAVEPETATDLTSPSGTHVGTGSVSGSAPAAGAAVAEISATAIATRTTTVRASPRCIGLDRTYAGCALHRPRGLYRRGRG